MKVGNAKLTKRIAHQLNLDKWILSVLRFFTINTISSYILELCPIDLQESLESRLAEKDN